MSDLTTALCWQAAANNYPSCWLELQTHASNVERLIVKFLRLFSEITLFMMGKVPHVFTVQRQ